MSQVYSMPSVRHPIPLDELRANANRFFMGISILLSLVTATVAWTGDQNIFIATGVSLLGFLAIAAAIKAHGGTLPAVVIVSASLAVQKMMLIFAASNMDPARL